ncbi:glutaminase [Arcobacter sp. CECT 8989]|uniref:glutaminase n=1 Tax=Arcobacter sp. CECT 8989 TaxID=2044509 RepID=UPI00100C0E83|nr:glutaminase [Arcobacter sp. CECT 8989]RXK01678.1 glutaminase [Arcobacter sp. CECT 8989]
MNYQTVLEEIKEEIRPYLNKGTVANYIPALANVAEDDFAMSIIEIDGSEHHIGSYKKPFSIQSISKVFTFTLALDIYGKDLYKRVGHEPSGNPFNSLIQLEYEKGIPRNPFINAGAIVTTDSLVSKYKENTFSTLLEFIKKVSNDENIAFNKEIFKSELESGYRNFALINMMKSFNNIENHTQEVIETYFKQCSIMMNTKQLTKSMLYLANHGVIPNTNSEIITQAQAKRINAVMLTCGHYDASGDFAFHVGLPGKSGVGGGIVAVVPQKMAICVYSPRLNKHGNSLVGTKALELFTTKTRLSIF